MLTSSVVESGSKCEKTKPGSHLHPLPSQRDSHREQTSLLPPCFTITVDIMSMQLPTPVSAKSPPQMLSN